jgi:hypothetical protein
MGLMHLTPVAQLLLLLLLREKPLQESSTCGGANHICTQQPGCKLYKA